MRLSCEDTILLCTFHSVHGSAYHYYYFRMMINRLVSCGNSKRITANAEIIGADNKISIRSQQLFLGTIDLQC